MARSSWILAACLALAFCATGPAHAQTSQDPHGAPDLGRKNLGTKAPGRQLTATLTCTSPLTKCGNDPYAKCVNLQTDVANCGTCSRKCPAGATCISGQCSCFDVTCNDTPFTLCGTHPYWTCKDLLTDEANCGACGRACPARSVCVKGTTCRCIDRSSYDNTTPFTLCGTSPYWTCKDLLTDEVNCGACGKKCPAGATCVNGDCVCPEAETRCGTFPYWTCKNLQTDEANCGACNTKCPAGATCNAGNCQCDSVDGKEITRCGTFPYWTCKSLTDDEANCGACNKKCPAGATCVNGDCVCPEAETRCGTFPYWTCKNLQTDEANCGACNTKCPAGATCNAGNCQCDSVDGKEITRCGTFPYWTCKSLTDDAANCGACNRKCPANATCVNGDCVCPAGQVRCGTFPYWSCKNSC